MRKLFIHVAIFLACSVSGFTQITAVTADQSPPKPNAGHDYIKLMNETVNPAVGSVDIKIGIDAPPGREVTVPFAVGYDSNSTRHSGFMDNAGYLAQGGWRYVLPLLQYSFTVTPVIGPGGSTIINWCDTVDGYIFTDMVGTLHPLGIDQSAMSWQDCVGIGNWATPIMQNTDGIVIGTTSPMGQSVGPNPRSPAVTVFDHDGMLYKFSNAAGHTHEVGSFYFYTADGRTVTSTQPDPIHADTVSSLPDFIETRNGNTVAFTDDAQGGGNGAFHITDTLGRNVVAVSSFGNNTSAGDTITVSEFGQPYKLTWGSASFNYTINGTLLQGTFPDFWSCGVGPGYPIGFGLGTANGVTPAITSIQLPNELSYQFLYDNPNNENPFGLLRKLIYPNGAYIRYVWGVNVQSTYEFHLPGRIASDEPNTAPPASSEVCEYIFDTPAVSKRFVSFDGVHEVMEQDFSYSTTWGFPLSTKYQSWTQKQTTVTTKDLVTSKTTSAVYTYAPLFDIVGLQNTAISMPFPPSHPGEILVQFNDSGKIVQTVKKTRTAEFFLPQETLTILDNGQASLEHIDYNGSNVVTDVYNYDWGTGVSSAIGPHGPLLRHMHADYNHAFPLNPVMPAITPTTPYSTTISDRPSALIVYDGSGNRASETDYGYDETTLASASAVSHDDQNFGTGFNSGRGNATTQTQKCFIGTQQCTQGDTVIQYAYDQTGQQVSRRDPNGNLTTYSFTDSFYDPAPPANAPVPTGNSNAFLTRITRPTTNGVSHVSNFSYAFSDGALTLAMDENGEQTRYTYNDPLRRLTTTDLPDGGQTQVSYNDTGANPSIVTTKKITGSNSIVSTIVMDGLGHTIQTQVNSDPQGVDYTDATYDGFGRIRTVSNPHRGSILPTDGLSTLDYDALGRNVQITKQDGGISSVAYTANCATTLDEAGKRSRHCNDAMDRLVEVDEPIPGTLETITAASATATITISGNLQSKQSSNHATGNITINGTDSLVPGTNSYDFGTVTAFVGGGSVITSYGNSGSSPSSSSSVASALCSAINTTSSTSSLATCSPNGSIMNLTAVAAATGGNGIGLGVSAQTQNPQSTQSAFHGSTTSGPLSGGGATIYDFATTTITVSGHGDMASWSGSGTTQSSIASSLAAAINSDPTAFVTASASGGTITLTANDVGLAGNNISLACSSGYDSTNFSGPSFSISCPSGLTGGREAGSLSAPMVTTYNFNALGDMLQVAQTGGSTDPTQRRNRSFTYDSLSRLQTSTTPESGTTSYSYDRIGNLVSKTSPQAGQVGSGTTTFTFCYDALSRMLAKGFVNSPYPPQQCATTPPWLPSPTVVNTFDQGANAIGKLSGVSDLAGTGAYTYDAMGRIATEQRTISGIPKSMGYTYNLDGSIATATYPSGATITYTSDSAGRTGMVQDLGSNINYVVGPGGPGTFASYGPDGALTAFLNGPSSSFNGITNTVSYNSRLQPLTMAAASLGATGTNATAAVTVNGSLASAFELPNNASPLSPNRGSNPGQAVYFDSNQHIIAAALTASGSSMSLDLTLLSGCCPAAPNSALATNVNNGGIIYQSANLHIHQIWSNSQSQWINNDMTLAGGATVAARSGTPLIAWADSLGIHEVYIGQDNHIYDSYYNGSNNSNSTLDLTSLSGGPGAAANSALSTKIPYGGVIYQSPDRHIHQIWWSSTNSLWVDNDMTAASGATVAARSGTPLAAYSDSLGIHEIYIGTDNHIYDLYYNGTTNSNSTLDLTSLSGGAGAAANSTLGSNVNSGVIVYQSADGHIHQIWWWSTNSRWVDNDVTAASGATVAARSGTPLAAFNDSQGIHETYIGQNSHVYDLFYNGSDSTRDMTASSSDSGVVSILIGSAFTASACFGTSTNSACTGQAANTTSSGVASALAQSLNASGSPVTATASGATINMTWKAPGPSTTPISAMSTTHDNPTLFPSPSFTSPATTFSGGTSVTVFSLNYDFHLGNGDNNNVWTITNNKDNTRNQTYTYDALNRLTSAQNAGIDCNVMTLNGKTKFWGNSYSYDGWGNLLQKNITKCWAEFLNATADVQNRIHVTAPDYQYDAAGNMLSDPTDNVNLTYDAENRVLTSSQNGISTSYVYDSEGNRVKKSSGGSGTLYWHMLPGVVAESDLNGNLKSEYIFFGGKIAARKDFPGAAVSYYFSDQLKTTNLITDAQGSIKAESDYYPWGGELQFVNNDSNHYKFTGKERDDSESGLDYFGARYYSNRIGRFITPDPSPTGVALKDPQSWNLYSYTRNRPTRFIDLEGNWATDVHAQIVTYAMQNYVSAAELSQLKSRQYIMDADQSDQTKHGMANKGQKSQAALTEMWQYVSDELKIAADNVDENGKLNTNGLSALGDAMHTVEDFTSPMHTDANFMPMEWNGGYWPPNKWVPGYNHVAGEGAPDQDWARIGYAIRLSMAAYLQSGASCQPGKRCLTAANFEAEAQRNIEEYVNQFYNQEEERGGYTERARIELSKERARQCALGNPAACGW